MKGVAGSRTGTGTWLVQRASAVGLALALPVLAVCFGFAPSHDFAAWQALFAPLWFRILLLLTGVSLALHAWVGMRDVLMDYVHPTALRLALYLAVITLLAGSSVWLAATLWSVP